MQRSSITGRFSGQWVSTLCEGLFIFMDRTLKVWVQPRLSSRWSWEEQSMTLGLLWTLWWTDAVRCSQWKLTACQAAYHDAVWYSLPGRCPSRDLYSTTAKCLRDEPGGNCDAPNGYLVIKVTRRDYPPVNWELATAGPSVRWFSY